MTIWRNKRNKKLYLIYQSTYHRAGVLTAEPYMWNGKSIRNAKLSNFISVAAR
jgi:hypothetical protein